MEKIQILEESKMDLTDSMLIIAFPTVGLVSTIAGQYITDSFKLDKIGAISSPYFVPAAVIHNGLPSPPVRIYAGKKTCMDNACSQLVVIISEFMPPPDLVQPLIDRIFDWAKEKQIKIILTLEGMHATNEKAPRTFGVATTPAMKALLAQHNIEEIKEGMIAGDSGVLLYRGVELQRDVLCLIAEAHAAYPDSRAAGKLLETLGKLLPGVTIDPEPLYKQASEIEQRIRSFLSSSKPTAPQQQSIPSSMYE
jgi:uncharacterized protein